MINKNSELRSNLLLTLTSLIWGIAFVAQSVGMDYVGPFTFNATRNILAFFVLLPVVALFKRRDRRLETVARGLEESQDAMLPSKAGDRKSLIIAGVSTGIVLSIASNLQQAGIQYTTVGKAGFITAMYILIVPILGLFLGRKASVRMWISVAIAVAGMYLLCISGNMSIGIGDMLMLLCALSFSVQILIIDHFSSRVNGLHMACLEFIVCGLICSVMALVFEKPDLSGILSAWMPILYAGALSSAVGYTLQIIAQKDTDPVIASLIMSLESAFSLLAGWIILNQHLSAKELLGCALMFVAIILSQLPSRTGRSKGGSFRKRKNPGLST